MQPVPIEIPLTHGYVALIDPCDMDLSELVWYAIRIRDKYIYPARWLNGASVFLHIVIAQRISGRRVLDNECVRHFDSNGLNNQRQNIQIVPRGTVVADVRTANKNNNSGFRGVYFDKEGKNWRASIRVNGKRINLGRFSTAELANAAYLEAASKYRGEFARTE